MVCQGKHLQVVTSISASRLDFCVLLIFRYWESVFRFATYAIPDYAKHSQNLSLLGFAEV